MSIEKRRERDKEEMRELILAAASEIAALEGFECISIRKIATKIEYSPSLIYHYFVDKDEIINNLMQSGYKKIVTAVSSVQIESTSPKDRLVQMSKNYIAAALKMPQEFMAAHLNKSPQALKHTASLYKGASNDKQALAELYECVKEINKDKELNSSKIEIIAQMIVVSSIGLIIKLIIEKDIDDEQTQVLINYFSEEVVLKIAKA